MTLPPTIPTSFVPHVSGARAQKPHSDYVGAFSLFAYAILGIAFLLALGVFLYGRILAGEQAAKDIALAKATATIDPATVAGFVRLRDRLNQSKALLNTHVAFSNFFASLQTLLPAPVRFSTLHLAVNAAGIASVEGSGVAKSFNALAAVSTAFARDGRIKDAIFSKISINKDNSVSFGFSATLDKKLVEFSSTPQIAAPEPLPQSAEPQPPTPLLSP